MTDMKPRAKILCVDDEPNILEGLALNLRRRYEVITAPGGTAGLAALQRDGAIEVVISDMRMPGMDGAAFLNKARQVAPNAVRMLLTGQTDLDSAIAAINQGQIFRFLTKPCLPIALILAVEAALEQHRLVTAERVLLEQTLHGSIEALTDVLALTSPVSFGRAIRIKLLVSEMAALLAMPERWQVEVAAMLSQLGCLTLPAETLENVYYGRTLSADEEQMVARLPALTEQLLGRIPRLETVRAILSSCSKPYRPPSPSTSAFATRR
ncbi:MAG: response regulator [Acidobacteriota bacterium]